jgi:hypothetical protein
MSKPLLTSLQAVFNRNNNQWLFLEALVPTLAKKEKFTIQLWPHMHNLPVTMRWRPCYTHFKQPGIYHPAKFKIGTGKTCVKPFPNSDVCGDWIECTKELQHHTKRPPQTAG